VRRGHPLANHAVEWAAGSHSLAAAAHRARSLADLRLAYRNYRTYNVVT
jgi:hypothetical protein